MKTHACSGRREPEATRGLNTRRNPQLPRAGADKLLAGLVLQPLHVQVSSCAPTRAGHVPEPGRTEHQGRVAVGKAPHNSRSSTDLTHDALQRVVGPNPPPVLHREPHVTHRLFNAVGHKLSGGLQLHGIELVADLSRLPQCRVPIL